MNMALELGDRLGNDANLVLNEAKVQFDMAVNNQEAFRRNAKQISGRAGLANRYCALLAATALVVIFASVNSAVTRGDATPGVTRVQIVK